MNRLPQVTKLFAGAFFTWLLAAALRGALLIALQSRLPEGGLHASFIACSLFFWELILLAVIVWFQWPQPFHLITAGFAGVKRAFVIVALSTFFTLPAYLLVKPDKGRRHQPTPLTEVVLPDPARDFFFPHRVRGMTRPSRSAEPARAWVEAAVLGQVATIFLASVAFYFRFARREWNQPFAVAVSGSMFGDARGGGMNR